MPSRTSIQVFLALACFCCTLSACNATNSSVSQRPNASTDVTGGFLGVSQNLTCFLQINQTGHSLSGMLTVYDTTGEYASGLIIGTMSGSHLLLWTTDANLKTTFAPVAEATLHGATITLIYQEPGAGPALTSLSLRSATVADYNRQVAKILSR